jgi:hypothetical protein
VVEDERMCGVESERPMGSECDRSKAGVRVRANETDTERVSAD